MKLKHPSSRTRSSVAGGVRHPGAHRSREISHIRRDISREPVVLIVERDALLRWALHETLTDAGFRVLAPPSSVCTKAWLVWLHEIDQDLSLALVDDDVWPLRSPLRAILATRWPSLPIVVMLHGRHPALEAQTRERGAAEVLVKPFDLAALVNMVERLTGFPHGRTDTRISPAV